MSDLKVNEVKTDTIKDQTGTTAMTIDSTGRVLTPARPYFRVGMGTSTSQITGGFVIFDTIKDNVGGHYDTSNGRFTAPLAGVYQFGHSILFQDVASGDDGITVEYRKNGANDNTTWLFDRADGQDALGYSGQGGYLNSRGSATFLLGVGDYVNMYLSAGGNGVGVHGNSNQSWSQWYGYLVG